MKEFCKITIMIMGVLVFSSCTSSDKHIDAEPVLEAAYPANAPASAIEQEEGVTETAMDQDASSLKLPWKSTPAPATPEGEYRTAPTPEAKPGVPQPTADSASSLTKTPPQEGVAASSAFNKSFPDAVVNPYFSTYGEPYDENGVLSNKAMAWFFGKNKNHQPPTAQKDFDIRQFDAYYLGDINKKEIYLTFDEGYENGYTEKILDVLKDKSVPAAFFVTKTYIRDNKELIQRMMNEGHIVGNHTVRHKSCPELSNEEMKMEIEDTADYYKEITGEKMPPFFRPPKGEYSARTLEITQNIGYKTIFWSFAYKDWEVDHQPGVDKAYNTVMDNLHNGEIMLLHAVSSSNTEALPQIIDSARELGFEFLSLNNLPQK